MPEKSLEFGRSELEEKDDLTISDWLLFLNVLLAYCLRVGAVQSFQFRRFR